MTESSPKRKFTAELRSLDPTVPDPVSLRSSLTPEAMARQRHREILDAIEALRTALAAGASQPSGDLPAKAPSFPELPGDADQLRHELQLLHDAISQTKREIAALRQMGKPPAHLANATDELDAVVHATESATEIILSSSERIDGLVTRLRNQITAGDDAATVEEIGDLVTRIFEACNFQDITGQRITKVVNALKFVEERVERMIEVLGGSAAFAAVEPVASIIPGHAAADEAHLLEGPQLDEHKISQDDIDAFFN